MGEEVFWLKSLYQLGFVCFFDFYFWIRAFCLLCKISVISYKILIKTIKKPRIRAGFLSFTKSDLISQFLL
ncbi:hypothetical protein BAZSYMA_ACONTIG72579_0 [Bathymodiolus azoricus thioautotrophic gill symbiont]|uniref:Uncharacterized protein n=2 Tax=sulfur-oxidizing symbionts TaxID=32036 RepID=A0A1H6JZX1_9GAMM|nr:hypothetical protein BAZSYMA_ACONTIG72579_0 [Bathymodiolus azoricus thioautotrophic gill symbiont]